MKQNIGKCVHEVCKELRKLNFSPVHDGRVQYANVTPSSEGASVIFRTAEQTQKDDVVELIKLNPRSFLTGDNGINCRAPECLATTTRRHPTDLAEKSILGLKLCEDHLTMLTNLVLKRCAKENVILNIASFSLEDINGYTCLIGWLEKAFRYIMKKSFSNPTDFVLAEVFLNTRNFLMITYTLLTSDDNDSFITVLVPYMMLLKRFLTSLNDPEMLHNLLVALQEVMNMVLSFFGIVYSWVFLPNAGAQVGSCVGVVLGFAGAIAYGCLPVGILATSVVGIIAGKLIGGGTYDWYRERRYTQLQKQVVQSYQQFMSEQRMKPEAHIPPLYYVPVNANGDLSLQT